MVSFCCFCYSWNFVYIFFQKNRKELKKQELPPFERAIEELKALENESLNKQEEFKRYYSRLTDVIRRYLKEEAKIDALESTSEELLLKLEMRKDAGTLDLDRKTLISLREVLQNADLAKFARSMTEFRIASEDRKVVETVVIETKEALPEPTEEELREKAAYQEFLAKKGEKTTVDLWSCWNIFFRNINFFNKHINIWLLSCSRFITSLSNKRGYTVDNG